MVPIVLGAYKEDYEAALPPNSYINVDDFSSIKQLTDYLLYLDRNDTAYASYFAWKEVGHVVVSNWRFHNHCCWFLCFSLDTFLLLVENQQTRLSIMWISPQA